MAVQCNGDCMQSRDEVGFNSDRLYNVFCNVNRVFKAGPGAAADDDHDDEKGTRSEFFAPERYQFFCRSSPPSEMTRIEEQGSNLTGTGICVSRTGFFYQVLDGLPLLLAPK